MGGGGRDLWEPAAGQPGGARANFNFCQRAHDLGLGIPCPKMINATGRIASCARTIASFYFTRSDLELEIPCPKIDRGGRKRNAGRIKEQ